MWLLLLLFFAAIFAFTTASVDVEIDEEGEMGHFCVVIVDDNNSGSGLAANMTVDLMTQAVGGTNEACECL